MVANDLELTRPPSPLILPEAAVLSLLSGKTENFEGKTRAIDGGALFGVEDQDHWWGVINHSLLVRRVAVGIGGLLNDHHARDPAWSVLNTALLGNAGMLEDFAKRYEKESPPGTTDHVKEGLRILKDADIPDKEKIERILVTHLYGMNGYTEDLVKPSDWTEKILVLADHYATGQIVSLDERFADFKRRHATGGTMPTEEEEFQRISDYCYMLQDELIRDLDLANEDALVDKLKSLPETYEESKLRSILRRPPEKATWTLEAVDRMQKLQALEKEKQKRNTVIFDIGGVVVENPDPKMYEHMMTYLGDKVNLQTLQEVFALTLPDLQTGKITEGEAFKAIQDDLGIQLSVSAQEFFSVDFKTHDEQIRLINELIEKGYKVALLTNTIPSHLSQIKKIVRDTLPLVSEKDLIASCDLGLRKSGERTADEEDIFKQTLLRLGIEPENAVFVDDNHLHVLQAESDEIVSIYYDGSIPLKKLLERQLPHTFEKQVTN